MPFCVRRRRSRSLRRDAPLAPGPAPAPAAPSRGRWELTDLSAYGASLGADLASDAGASLAWLVREAFEAPLPKGWTQHGDDQGRAYFCDGFSGEITWSHPMDSVYRELIGLVQNLREEEPDASQERWAAVFEGHLTEARRRALEKLWDWSGPYDSEEGPYYYERGSGRSSWVDPVCGCEHELALRHSVLQRCLAMMGAAEAGAAEAAKAAAAVSGWRQKRAREAVEEETTDAESDSAWEAPSADLAWEDAEDEVCIDSSTAVPLDLYRDLLRAAAAR